MANLLCPNDGSETTISKKDDNYTVYQCSKCSKSFIETETGKVKNFTENDDGCGCLIVVFLLLCLFAFC